MQWLNNEHGWKKILRWFTWISMLMSLSAALKDGDDAKALNRTAEEDVEATVITSTNYYSNPAKRHVTRSSPVSPGL